jgi:predicted nucleic acid-binding protein
MTKILVDTSALLAILSVRDRAHKIAKQIWDRFVLEDVSLYTHNYLIVEASALIQNRLGMNATQDLHRKILPVLEIEWITHQQHQEIINTYLLANRRQLSLVDCASFETMRRHGIRKAFTFDKHFAEQGFEIIGQESS